MIFPFTWALFISSMEIEGEDGSKIYINKTGSKTDFGRGLGFRSDDRSVSRRQISFELCSFDDEEDHNRVNPDTELPRVSFEVLGRNPIWVYGGSEKDVRVFRTSDKGEMNVGDCFCVSAMNPILFTLKKIGVDGGEEDNKERFLKEGEGLNITSSEDKDMMEVVPSSDGEFTVDEKLGFGAPDASEIDPVKEFGFVVMGHEFDNYPKQMIRDIKNLDWCIEEPKEFSEDDETTMRNRSKRKKSSSSRGKKNNIENEDDDWTGESEDEKVLISKLGKDIIPRYTKTRSKDSNKPIKDTGSTSKTSANMKTIHIDDDDDEDNLGGFIVNEEEEKYDEDEDEEEEEKDYEEDEDDDLNGEEEI